VTKFLIPLLLFTKPTTRTAADKRTKSNVGQTFSLHNPRTGLLLQPSRVFFIHMVFAHKMLKYFLLPRNQQQSC
jgi:hypothetical protein